MSAAPDPGSGAQPLADAYLPWAIATDFRDAGGLRPGGWHWLLLELNETARDFALRARETAADGLRVPAHYLHPPRQLDGIDGTTFCTAACTTDFLHALRGPNPVPVWAGAIAAVKRFEIGLVTDAPPDPYAEPVDFGGADAAPVVIGVIDDRLGIAHARFRAGDATRLLGFWNQDDRGSGGAWTHGRVHTRAALDAAFAAAAAKPGGFDETAVYATLGYDAVRHRLTHGTHVLDLAGGADAGDGRAPPLVAVQVPAEAIQDTSCASTTVYLLDALRFVLAQADAVSASAGPGAAVINLSIGNTAGPHDGSSIFEKALAQLITARGNLDVVMAAGNSYLARGHAEITLGAGTTALPDWHVLADDGTPSFLELWFPSSTDVDALTLTVHSPRGEVQVLAGPGELRFTDRGQVVALASLQQRTASGEAPMALIAVAPTTWAERWDVPAPSGRWKVELQHAGTQPIVCQAYVQRDDAAIGRPTRGRQSWLDDPGYERLDARGDLQLHDNPVSTVRRAGTLNGLATGAGVHVAGGALARAGGVLEPARYASAPDAERRIAGPDEFALAITEDSPVLAGVLAAGTASGSVLALSGTSTAAPQLARQLAMRRVTGALAVAWEPAQDFQGRAVSVLPVAAGRRTRHRRRIGLPP